MRKLSPRSLDNLVVTNGVDEFIATKEVDATVFFPNPFHFAVEGVVGIKAMEGYVALSVVSHIADVVVAARPHDTLGVAEQTGNAVDARGMYYAPVGIVIV